MTTKKQSTLPEDFFAGNALIKTLKVIALICVFVGFIFAVGAFVSSREGFGVRGFIQYVGTGFASGIVVFALAEILRFLQAVYERFDLYEKIDR